MTVKKKRAYLRITKLEKCPDLLVFRYRRSIKGESTWLATATYGVRFLEVPGERERAKSKRRTKKME